MQYAKDLQSVHSKLFLEARRFLLSYEGIQETKKERITSYSNDKGGICHLRTMPYGIDFGFLKGVKLNDEYGLLSGKGKTLRILSQKKSLDKKVLQYYLEQALEINGMG